MRAGGPAVKTFASGRFTFRDAWCTLHAVANVAEGVNHDNFLLESVVNTNFCIDDGPGFATGRALLLQSCTTVDTQRWALTDNADGTNALDDSQGMCVDTTGRTVGDGIAVAVFDCRFGMTQRFRYTVAGLVQAKGTNTCLSVPGAASNASVSLATCDATKTGQQWKLAH